jgi:hypothetical protein
MKMQHAPFNGFNNMQRFSEEGVGFGFRCLPSHLLPVVDLTCLPYKRAGTLRFLWGQAEGLLFLQVVERREGQGEILQIHPEGHRFFQMLKFHGDNNTIAVGLGS